MEALTKGKGVLEQTRVSPGDATILDHLGVTGLQNGASLLELLRRPEVTMAGLRGIAPELAELPHRSCEQLEISVKYAGYIQRQQEEIDRFRRTEGVTIPENFEFKKISGLSSEVVEKLDAIRPLNLGQASRIPGVTPAAIAILSVLLRRG